MSVELSEFDRRLLDAVQRGVPLIPRPYGQLAAGLGATEEQVLARVEALGGPGGILREIVGIFDATALGYASTLAAARCDPVRLDEAGRTVAAHPGVSHCYARQGPLNLWFTLVVPADSRLGLPGTLKLLAGRIGAQRMLSLRMLRRYKLDVRFEMARASQVPPARARDSIRRSLSVPAATPTAEQIRAIRALQRPLPTVPEPFAALAATEGLDADDLLVFAADFLAAGWMRRYAGVLRHRAAGAKVNVLVAWEVPRAKADVFAAQAAGLHAVSHCYLRAVAADWPYSLYTMIHGGSAEDVDRTIEAIVASAGDFPRVSLPTTSEYKKAAVRLFDPEFARWEAQAGS